MICFIFFYGCGTRTSSPKIEEKKPDSSLETKQTPSVSQINSFSNEEYKILKNLSNEALARRALVGKLGDCKLIQRPTTNSRDCVTGNSYQLYLNHLEKWFVQGAQESDTNLGCAKAAYQTVKEVFDAGLCYPTLAVSKDETLKLSDYVISIMAQYGKLGSCKLVPFIYHGSSYDMTLFGIHLVQDDVYFPDMNKDINRNSVYSFENLGPELRIAIMEGYCFKI